MATALASAAVAQNKPLGVPTLDVSDFNRSGTNSRRSARTGNKDSGPSAADQQDAYNDAMDRLLSDNLRNMQELTDSVAKSAALEIKRIDVETKAYSDSIDKQVLDKKITAANGESLKKQNEANAIQDKAIVARRLEQTLFDQYVEAISEDYGRRKELLSLSEGMVRTNTERRRIEKELLDIEIEEKKLAARRLIATGDEEKVAEGKRQLAGIDAYRTGKEKSINQSTMTPLQQYLDAIPKTQDEINERFNQIAADGLSSFNEGLVAAGTNLIGLKGLAGSLFNQLISDLLRFQIQAATRSIFGDGGGFLSGLGGLFGGGGTAMSAGFNASFDATFAHRLPGLAVGGDILIGGNSGIDKNVLSLNGRPTAMVGRGEVISVTPTTGKTGGGNTYNFSGNLMTEEFWQRIAQGDAVAASTGAQAGSMGAQKAIAGRQKRFIR